MNSPVELKTTRPATRAWGMILTGALLLVIAAWFESALLKQYDCSVNSFPLRTAGWFILGLPFTIPIGLAQGAFFSRLARQFGRRMGWCLLLGFWAILIVLAVRASRPSVVIEKLIGKEAAELVTLEVVGEGDSFGDGKIRAGRLSGDEEAMRAIAVHRKLTPKEPEYFGLLDRFFPNMFPERGTIHVGMDATFYFDRESSTIYFVDSDFARARAREEP